MEPTRQEAPKGALGDENGRQGYKDPAGPTGRYVPAEDKEIQTMTKPQEIAVLRAEARRLHLNIIILWKRGKGGWWAGETLDTLQRIGFNRFAAKHNLQRMAGVEPD